MPCVVNEPTPSGRMKHLQHVATLQVYVRQKLGLVVMPWLVQNAKDLWKPDDRSETDLCELMKTLGGNVRDDLLYGNPRDPMLRKLADWWETHQAADAKREALQRTYAERAQAKARALAKLTDEDRKLLGL